MTKNVAIVAELPQPLAAELQSLALSSGRSTSGLIADALQFYIASERDFVAAVEEGLMAMARGDTVDHETIVQDLDERLKRRGT